MEFIFTIEHYGPGQSKELNDLLTRFDRDQKFVLAKKPDTEKYEFYMFGLGRTHSDEARFLESRGYKILGGGFIGNYFGGVIFVSTSMRHDYGYDCPQNAGEILAELRKFVADNKEQE